MMNLGVPDIAPDLRPRITVFGVGGAGGNAVNNMIKSNLEGVEFVVANTDAQALAGSLAQKRIQLGTTITRGLGAGSRPDVGRAAAEEQLDEILSHLDGANMVFITAGMGGGTGTGAAPVIARAAREQGILTVGVVTKPFHFEGAHRMRLAEAGIKELQQYVDTLIIIPNQNLFRIATEKTTFADAFKMADDVLYSGVRGVTDLMVMPGLINLDFADIRSVMTEMGKAMMGTGEASGERRAIEAAEAAISNPLLDDVSMKGARGVLINITGGLDMTLFEVDEAANRIRDEVDPDANIIFGSTFDESLEGIMRVSVVATGIDGEAATQPRPGNLTQLSLVSDRSRKPSATGLAAPAKDGPRTAPDYHASMVAAPLPTQGNVAVARSLEPTPEGLPVAQAETVNPPVAEAQLATTAAAMLSRAPIEPAAPAPEPAASARPRPAEHAPTGPLRGEQRGGAFIPPAPAQAGPRPQPATAPAEGFVPAGARAENAERPRRTGSLFARVTGLGRRLSGTADSEPQPERQPPAVQVPSQPAAARPQPAPQQPRLGGLDALERAPARPQHHDEDMLDIPAFLRRQAN